MAQLSKSNENGQSLSRKRAGVRRMLKHSLRVDMTPMVDLGFLLITFFVIKTELSKPTAMDLAMTKDGPPIELQESTALTVLIDKANSIYYYEGKWEDAFYNNKIHPITLSGVNNLRKLIISKQQRLDHNVTIKEGGKELMMLIKPGNNTNYKTIIDILDETIINLVEKYAVLKQSLEEIDWLKSKQE